VHWQTAFEWKAGSAFPDHIVVALLKKFERLNRNRITIVLQKYNHEDL